ncbi:hypothetical protein B0I37DRAFT_338784 [Chaetomium sp. MPI-CAGE-AT-0009]|nr:hypothetical protein B0I37DRAFT_338784 [Chaetomium sp. MPI-CAGE-AT-0009]
MVAHTHPSANRFVRSLRNVYNPLGFAKGYNFTLWVIFGGALLGFSLAKTPYLNFYGVFCDSSSGPTTGAVAGECWYYRNGARHETVGMIMHLVTVIPASILVVFQFIPVIRHKLILLHRINGYLVIFLSLAGTAGALMITRHAFGGGLDTQTGLGLMSIMFVSSMVMAYINIKRLQIEEHRAWMLRAWCYAGAIVTVRFITSTAGVIISNTGGYYAARPCGQVDYMLGGNKTATLSYFPDCAAYYSGENLEQYTLVQANMDGDSDANTAAALGLAFSTAVWLALALHAIGVEIYLRLTPAEHERLKKVSYQRQCEAGMKNPGRAGLTANRLGDADAWVASEERRAASAV